MQRDCAVDLYWLPLGAGGNSVRFNGCVYEALVAWNQRRMRCDLYHSALEVTTPEGRYVIEMAPIRDRAGSERGVVAEGAVGSRLAGRLRLFATRSGAGSTDASPMSLPRSRARSG